MSRDFDLAELTRLLANLIRIGTVTEVDCAAARARVQSGQVVTGWLPWLAPRAGNDGEWWPLDVGEQVVVLAPGGDLAAGAILGSIYQNAHPAPSNDPNLRRTVYADGMVIEHDRAAKRLVIDAMAAEGTIELRAKNIVLKTGEGGFFHLDHFGKATRITHIDGPVYETEAWETGAVVIAKPVNPIHPPEVEVTET